MGINVVPAGSYSSFVPPGSSGGGFFGNNLSPGQAGILGGLAGGTGYLGQGGNQTSNSTTTGSGSSGTSGVTQGSQSSNLQSLMNLLSSGSSAGTQTQSLGPEGAAVFAQLFPQLQNLQPFNPTTYQGAANTNINAGAQAQQNNAANSFAARGIANSPAAAVTNANIDANRIGQQVQVGNTLPQAAQQYNLQNISGLGSILAQLPRNVSSTGTTTNNQQQSGTQTGQSNAYGSNSSETGYNNTANTQGQTQTQTGGGLGGLLGGIGGLLGTLFGLGGK